MSQPLLTATQLDWAGWFWYTIGMRRHWVVASNKRRTLSVEVKFLRGFTVGEKNSCWEWSLGRDKDGYGRIRQKGGDVKAHRIAYERHHGTSIPLGLLCCHSCDNPPCVNPAHLFLGTHRANSDDKLTKKRQAYGSGCGASKLTERDVVKIMSLAKRMTQRKIAKLFGIGQGHVSRLVNRKEWSHLQHASN